ncbi:MAG TPA: low molecular weight phosphotyrosine protein phosphatase, partial [Chitinophagaceae bacterium]|nr:low molecular weight phosphotyrosine protein phosphatase [Chitinophagaceae bacterium]
LFDKIYVMDTNNYLEVKEIAGKLWNENKVKLILSELYLNENKNVPDPWYGDEKDYYAVYELLDKACDAVITSLNK